MKLTAQDIKLMIDVLHVQQEETEDMIKSYIKGASLGDIMECGPEILQYQHMKALEQRLTEELFTDEKEVTNGN